MPRSLRPLPAKTPDRPGGRVPVPVPVATPAGCGDGAARVASTGRETERAR
ncbi:hypothetical protein SAMN05216505_108175 [Streptomyces prasinopilosus]|uniref:Uncharacterized protein n=1 Tax=Streptomyces prasinopilosus TaxID=67344 RepID=A0A1G6VAV4_9ACTN|nr:hypothetical protein SAMN05216505_108175 [Streptomyces prasinopilosus]